MTNRPESSSDAQFMDLAIAMARRGLGRTAPNPSVGAVLVDEASHRVISRGWTQPGGRPHAEPHAIAQAGEHARGATLYVTLEPCSHHGRSPPCADAIIAAGISRVVCGLEDPDPRVAGRGIERLRRAGLTVEIGIRRKECHQLTLGHILRVTERRPFVQLKLALDADGAVPRGGDGKPTWVTGANARRRGHLLRAQTDAILIGSKTLHDDNPTLNCRLPGLQDESPIRVVLASEMTSSKATLTELVQADSPIWWVLGLASVSNPPSERPQDCVLQVTSVANRPWLPAVMEALVQNGVTRLLVEGGPTMWRAFDRANLVDEVVLFQAKPPDDRESKPFEPGETLSSYVSQTPMKLVEAYGLNGDRCCVFRRGTIPLWWTAS